MGKIESQEEDGDIEVEEAEGEENDRPYNLRDKGKNSGPDTKHLQ